ncbi:O-succinylbenzoic acid--CoA ligase [Lunatimonas lonarensis]|uniref:O-succinylbenzoic acid--CoA ligase n=1 Tax=Lunatimonas lonarensis TaxID=1232681 RepID=R7ZPW9_9BACT|nr:O-succinylbenzoic acid--CoA ligase [Lunatimonas lonarensis]
MISSAHQLSKKLIFTTLNSYTFEEIKQGKWTEDEPEWTGAFQFCYDWLNGTNIFTLNTSGSTGSPKLIEVSREQMRISARNTRRFLNLGMGCSLLCSLNTEMIAGKMMLVRALEWQSKLYLSKPSTLISSPVDDVHIDLAAVVPMQLEASLENPESRALLNRIENLLVGGAPISPTLKEKTKDLKNKVYQTFGMTETVSHIAMADLKCDGPLIYKALPGVKLTTSKQGTLVIQAKMAIAPKLETNDLVELVGKNSFIWKGRIDFVINSGGIKLYPEQIESEIEPLWRMRFPGTRFFIWKTPDPTLGEAVLLVVEKLGTTEPNMAAFLMELKLHLPKYHIPKAILSVDQMQTTESSKINKLETLKPYLT